jgi:acetyl-CoA acetyltransferase
MRVQCGSSQQAIHFAAQAVMSGTQDVVIAGGVEVMSLVPIGSNVVGACMRVWVVFACT